jgi:hypothetical protein
MGCVAGFQPVRFLNRHKHFGESLRAKAAAGDPQHNSVSCGSARIKAIAVAAAAVISD